MAYCADLTPHNDGFFVTSICCVNSWIWSFLVFFYARQYNNLCQEGADTTSVEGYAHDKQTLDSFEREESDSSMTEIIRQTIDGG